MTTPTTKPSDTEYAPDYGRYVSLVPPGNITETLRNQMKHTLDLLGTLNDSQGLYRYAPGKWSLKELIGHVVDAERIFAYRLLRFARNDKTPIPGFEQDGYVLHGGFDHRELNDLASEYQHVRLASLDLIENLSDEAWDRRGIASEREVSVRALAWIISGHELHHKEVIRTRYVIEEKSGD